MMHQHMQHDIFGHACGEIADRHPNQRHPRQAGIGGQRVDTGTEIENDAQIWKGRQRARGRLPDRGIMDVGGVASGLGPRHYAPVAADRVEPVLPPFRRPVIGAAVHDQRERALLHRISPHPSRMSGDLTGPAIRCKIFPTRCRSRAYCFVFQPHRNPSTCSTPFFATTMRTPSAPGPGAGCGGDAEAFGGAGQIGPSGPARPGRPAAADDGRDHAAQGKSARRDRWPVRRDQGQLLGFYIVDCSNLDEALAVARDLGAAIQAAPMKSARSASSIREPQDVTDAAWIDAALTSARPRRSARCWRYFAISTPPRKRSRTPAACAEKLAAERAAARSRGVADHGRAQCRDRRSAEAQTGAAAHFDHRPFTVARRLGQSRLGVRRAGGKVSRLARGVA